MKKWLLEFQSGWYMTLLFVLCIVIWQIAGSSGRSKPINIQNFLVQSTVCNTGSSNVQGQFYIYSSGEGPSRRLNSEACGDPVVNKQFGYVKSFWGVTDVNTIQIMGKGVASLALVKENIMDAIGAEETYGYKKIATYPTYKAYFIARTEKPRIEKDYLLDKTIGLINYPTSRSGHVIPKQVLGELGLSLNRLNIVYASSHSQLRKLLASGKVDIISSYWQKEDLTQFSDNYRTQISSAVSGSSWYLKLQQQNNDLLCASQLILQRFSEQQELSYYKNLDLIPFAVCNDFVEHSSTLQQEEAAHEQRSQ